MKTLRLSATLAALMLAASTASAAVMDLGNALGPSGQYTNQAYYKTMLGGQPMTAAQQAYADQEDQLRQLGYRAELGGDFALGQMFYHMAYGLTPGSPSAGLGWLGAPGRDPIAPSDGGSSYGSDGSSSGSVGDSVLTVVAPPIDPGIGSVIAVPEASTWAMMLLGFAGLVYAGRRGSRKAALHST